MNIVIVGGGSAGWLAAFGILKTQPGIHNVTMIESTQVGIIGVGEASTGALTGILLGDIFNHPINIDDFIRKTDATPKYGIRHVNWTNDMDSYFAPIDNSISHQQNFDHIFRYVLYKYGNKNISLASPLGIKYSVEDYSQYPSAFMFDSTKFGYFMKELCSKDNLSIIDAKVENIKLDTGGDIESLVLDNGSVITGDLFIDCTGFNSILMNKVGNSRISYKDTLPLDTTIVFPRKYKENEKFIPETTATALSSGWMFDVRIQTRIGRGYSFDSNFLTIDQAKDEVEKYLGEEIEVKKVLKYETGHLKEFWKNNVIAFGLSSSFFEPLEATSIHNTIYQISLFVYQFLHKEKEHTMNQNFRDIYNKTIFRLQELTADFISIHYQGGRDNSDFWKHMTNNKIITPGAKEFLYMYKNNIPNHQIMINKTVGSFSVSLVNWNIAGMGLISQEQAYKELVEHNMLEIAEQQFQKIYWDTVNEKNIRKDLVQID